MQLRFVQSESTDSYFAALRGYLYDTAVVENKRLGHALAIVKAQQDRKLEAKVLTNGEKTGYKKRPRQVFGSNST